MGSLQVTQLPPEARVGNRCPELVRLFQSSPDLGVEVALVLVVVG
jgi:hypothetical protein